MATPQPQSPPPQQPIYAAELNFILDRHFARMTSYFDDRFRGSDARMDGIINQMSVDRQESRARDDALLKRIENVEATQKVIIDLQRQMQGTIETMQGQIATLETFQQTMLEASKAQTEDILRTMQDLHALAMEAINELRPKDIE